MDKINIRMSVVFSILLILPRLIIANDFQKPSDFIEREVISGNRIENSGLFRISDILLLTNKVRVNTIDGFAWSASINGLSSFQRQSWTVLLNGHPIELNTFNNVNVNMLPINITQIDSVEIITVPQIYDGKFTDYGLIHIHTKSKSQGTVLSFSQSAGNETGDPGPYAYTKYKSPNVEIVGSGTSFVLDSNNDNNSIILGMNYEGHTLTDLAMKKRVQNIYKRSDDWIIPELYPNPSIEKTSIFFNLKRKGIASNYNIFTSYTHSNKYFLYFEPIGSEIPIEYIIKYAGINYYYKFSNKMEIAYRLHYTKNQFNKYPNTLDMEFDWESDNFHVNIENKFRVPSYSGRFGFGLDRYSLNTDYELDKSFYDIYNIYFQFNHQLIVNINHNIDFMYLFSNGKRSIKGTSILKWSINPIHKLNFIVSKTERLLEEENSLWYWSNLGYDIVNTDYTINGGFNKSNVFTADLVLESKINEELTVAVSNYYRYFNNSYIVQQFFNVNSENGNVISSPIEIFTNQEGNILGVNLALKSNIKPSISQYLQYDYQGEFHSDDLFKNKTKSFPKHIVDYHLNYSPIESFSIWTKWRYISSTQWENYKNINGLVYQNIHQDSLEYSDTIRGINMIDIGIQKWLFKRKIKSNMFLRNVLNQSIRYHPIGASYDLTLFFQITLFPYNIY